MKTYMMSIRVTMNPKYAFLVLWWKTIIPRNTPKDPPASEIVKNISQYPQLVSNSTGLVNNHKDETSDVNQQKVIVG